MVANGSGNSKDIVGVLGNVSCNELRAFNAAVRTALEPCTTKVSSTAEVPRNNRFENGSSRGSCGTTTNCLSQDRPKIPTRRISSVSPIMISMSSLNGWKRPRSGRNVRHRNARQRGWTTAGHQAGGLLQWPRHHGRATWLRLLLAAGQQVAAFLIFLFAIFGGVFSGRTANQPLDIQGDSSWV